MQRKCANHQEWLIRAASQGISPNRLNTDCRVGRGKVLDPAEERRVPHVDGDEQHLVQREEHGNLDHHRQAAGQRVDLLLLVKLHHLLLLLDLVVLEALAHALHLRLELLHLAHRAVGGVRQREEQRLHEHGEDQDRDAEIARRSDRESRSPGTSAW